LATQVRGRNIRGNKANKEKKSEEKEIRRAIKRKKQRGLRERER